MMAGFVFTAALSLFGLDRIHGASIAEVRNSAHLSEALKS
jgi:hypothetical protein